MSPSVLVVGSINSDLVLRTARLPRVGESLIGAEYRRIAGGKGANQAVAAARLGATVAFVGRTGLDSEGEALRDNLRSEGVRIDFARRCPQAQTGLAVITVDEQGQNSIVVIPGANNEVVAEDVDAALRAGSYDALMLQLEIPAATVLASCRLAAARGGPVVLDAGPAQTFALEQLQGVHVLTPNETETFVLTGIKPDTQEDARAAAGILLRRSGARAVVLKLGDRGALLCDSHGVCEYFPAYRVDAVDATAAGDAFTAAMTVEYVRARDLRQAVMLGNAAGALAAMSLGAQPSLPTAQALAEFCSRQAAHAS